MDGEREGGTMAGRVCPACLNDEGMAKHRVQTLSSNRIKTHAGCAEILLLLLRRLEKKGKSKMAPVQSHPLCLSFKSITKKQLGIESDDKERVH